MKDQFYDFECNEILKEVLQLLLGASLCPPGPHVLEAPGPRGPSALAHGAPGPMVYPDFSFWKPCVQGRQALPRFFFKKM